MAVNCIVTTNYGHWPVCILSELFLCFHLCYSPTHSIVTIESTFIFHLSKSTSNSGKNNLCNNKCTLPKQVTQDKVLVLFNENKITL